MSEYSNTPAVLAGGEIESYNLQVVSPSVGVNGPLSFPKLPRSTTVKQLKEKIREALPMRPSDEHQRLIHQGRLLANDAETMLEILGQDKLKNSDTQTLHLVLRPAHSETTAPRNSPAMPNNQVHPSNLRPPPPSLYDSTLGPRVLAEMYHYENGSDERQRPLEERNTAQHPQNHDARMPRFPTPPILPAPFISLPPTLNEPASSQSVNNPQNSHVPHVVHNHIPQVAHGRHPLDRQPLQAMQLIVQQLQQEHERFHREHFAQHLPMPNSLGGAPQPGPRPPQIGAEESSFQELIAQSQRERAAMGMHGAQRSNISNSNLPSPLGAVTPQGLRPQYLPQQTRIRTHELSGSNGERWQVTVNETTTVHHQSRAPINQTPPFPGTPMAREVNDLIQNMMGSGNRAPGLPPAWQLPIGSQLAGLQSIPGIPMGVTQPAGAPIASDSHPINNPMANSQVVSEQPASTAGANAGSHRLAGPQVYILSSPVGPQALVVTPAENGVEAFFTPQYRSTGPSRTDSQPRHDGAAPDIQAAAERRLQRREARAQRQIRLQAEGPNVRPARRGNPPAGRVAIQLWPHVWLIIRLMIFVWFFATGENRSWYQFITVTGLAVIVFVASVGIFNGIADQVWAPFRRHLEGLVPLAAPNNAHRAIPNNHQDTLNNANADAAAPGPGAEVPVGARAPDPAAAEPHPAEAAARLIEQRRQLNGTWLWTQIRRAEHAMILFLASLIPGVGERHVAARAAEENLLLEAERLRRDVGAAAERVEAVEEQLRVAMGEMINVAAGVAALRAEPNTDEGPSPIRERTEMGEVGGDENAAARPEHGNALRQAGEEAPQHPLIEI